jgi:hypothetical protein
MRQVARGDLTELFETADAHDSFEDWPWPLVCPELDRRYAEARFILTIRKDARTWFQSLLRHAEELGQSETRRLVYGHAMPHGREEEHADIYEAHNRNVRRHFRGRPWRLLEVCWETGSGWQELCAFLGKEVPPSRFPHENRSSGSVSFPRAG